MSIRFKIKNITEKAQKESDGTIIRFSGKAEPYSQSTDRECNPVGYDSNGKPKLIFTTGLDIEKVDLYRWYTEEEKAEVKKQIKEYTPVLAKAYGGADVLVDTNVFFWRKKREVGRFAVSHEIENFEFDTKNPQHALLYFSIISGAFMDVVAPCKRWLESNPNLNVIHYLELETEENQFDGDEDITRAEAMSALMSIKDNPEALFLLAWCLQYDTTAFGAYSKSISPRNLMSYHIQYIDGKLKLKGVKKKNFPKTFLEYFNKWEGQQTRPKVYTEAYVKAADYYSILNKNADKKFQTLDGVVLGVTIQEIVENLHKNKFQQDYEKLRDLVEAKWKE